MSVRRIACCITALVVWSISAAAAATSAASAPIPASTLVKIKALYGSFTRVPTFVPAGEVFITWNVSQPQYQPSYINKSLNITWARNGTELYWSVSDARIQGDSTCSTHPQTFPPGWVKTINGHKVVYSAGNHTSGLATCVHALANGSPFPLDVAVNWDNGPSRPPLSQLERMLLSGLTEHR